MRHIGAQGKGGLKFRFRRKEGVTVEAPPFINVASSFRTSAPGVNVAGPGSFRFRSIPRGQEFRLVPMAFAAAPWTQILVNQYGEPSKSPNAPSEYGAEQMKPMPDFSNNKNSFNSATSAIGRDRSSGLCIAA